MISGALQAQTEVIIDNGDPGFSVVGASWWTPATGTGYYGANFHTTYAGTGSDYARYSPGLSTGTYEVYARFTNGWQNLGTDCPYVINHTTGQQLVRVDQTINGGTWVSLGQYALNSSSYVDIRNDLANDKRPCADALRFVLVSGGGGGSGTNVEYQVSAGSDDDETDSGTGSSDLELGSKFVGLRFVGVQIPQGATINSASVLFRQETGGTITAPALTRIFGEDADNAVTYSSTSVQPDGRVRTTAFQDWSTTAIDNVATPDIAPLIQEIVSRSGWQAGNALGVLFRNDGGRADAASFNHNAAWAPILRINYSTSGGGGSGNPPSIYAAASASPTTVTASTALLSVRASDPEGGALTYTWSATKPSGAPDPTYSDNASATARDTTVTFYQAGSYTLTVQVTDTQNLSVSSSVNVTVQATLSEIEITPASAVVTTGGTRQFSYIARDQFDNTMSVSVSWSVLSGGVGTVNSSGLYTAPSGTGTASVRVSSGSFNDTASVIVQAPSSGGTVTRAISASTDDAEENWDGTVVTNDIDHDLNKKTVGLRFTNIAIPQGATINSAYIDFEATGAYSAAATVTIKAENSNDAATFVAGTVGTIASRPATTQSVSWTIPAWSNNEKGADTKTPNLATLVQAVVNRSGWASGNDLAFIITETTGTDRRKAKTFDNAAAAAPTLTINWGTGGGGGGGGGTFKVVLAAGQSNMVGKGDLPDLPSSLSGNITGVEIFVDGSWIPLRAGTYQGTKFGPELSFGKEFRTLLGEDFGIIKLAQGSTSLAVSSENAYWSVSNQNSLYYDLKALVDQAAQGRDIEVIGFIWMQGEKDSKDTSQANQYAQNLANLINQARSDFSNPNMVFVAGRIAVPNEAQYVGRTQVRTAQSNLGTDTDPDTDWVNTDDLPKEDTLHYNSAGLITLGERFAAELDAALP